MQALTMQKQTLQMQEAEIDNALEELGKVKTEKVFEIVGNILINKKPDELKKSLTEKKKRTDLRLESIEKQLKRITSKAQELQKEVMDIAKEESKK
jgi:prefoldin beta subunit